MKHHALPHSLGQTANVAAVRKPWSLRLRLLAWALALALGLCGACTAAGDIAMNAQAGVV